MAVAYHGFARWRMPVLISPILQFSGKDLQ